MKKLSDYGMIGHLTDSISIEKVYPLSILEGVQRGEIYVDDLEAPTVALIWHYCGFANILGDYDEKFIKETVDMMADPPEGHSGRMALQADNDPRLQEMILSHPGVTVHERFIFEYFDNKNTAAHSAGLEPEMITSDNYDLMKGRIIPTFSWEDKDSFLRNGFGFCMIDKGRMSACAFSSGVSKDYVDIGVETAEECRRPRIWKDRFIGNGKRDDPKRKDPGMGL